MRIVFMGSSDLSCMCLRALLSEGHHDVVGVVTQPDRPSGRRLAVAPCMAKLEAGKAGLPVHAHENVNDPDSVATLRGLSPDAIVVVAYGQILRPNVLELPPQGCVNMHYSLLPRYRGAGPIQWAIANGDRVTGVTAMYMNERMDAGDIIRQVEVGIEGTDTACDLHARLGAEGARVLLTALRDIENGRATRTPQDEAMATVAPKLKKSDGRIDWTVSARDIYNRVRGFNPWPSCFCMISRAKRPRLRILASRIEDGLQGAAGEVLDVGGDGPVVGTGTHGLRLLEVQPEGGRRMAGDEYVRGHALAVGCQLE